MEISLLTSDIFASSIPPQKSGTVKTIEPVCGNSPVYVCASVCVSVVRVCQPYQLD